MSGNMTRSRWLKTDFGLRIQNQVGKAEGPPQVSQPRSVPSGPVSTVLRGHRPARQGHRLAQPSHRPAQRSHRPAQPPHRPTHRAPRPARRAARRLPSRSGTTSPSRPRAARPGPAWPWRCRRWCWARGCWRPPGAGCGARRGPCAGAPCGARP